MWFAQVFCVIAEDRNPLYGQFWEKSLNLQA